MLTCSAANNLTALCCLAEGRNKTHLTPQTQFNVFEVINESDFLPLLLSAPSCCHGSAHLDQICRLAPVWKNRRPPSSRSGCTVDESHGQKDGVTRNIKHCASFAVCWRLQILLCPILIPPPLHTHPSFSLQLSHDSLSPHSRAGVAIVSCSYVEATVH